jgi:hypothetical protein
VAHVHPIPPENPGKSPDAESALATRPGTLLWGPGGFTLLILVGIFIAREDRWTFTFKDVLYWGVVAAMLVARVRDGGKSRDDDRRDERPAARVILRYAATLLILAGLAWFAGHSVRI